MARYLYAIVLFFALANVRLVCAQIVRCRAGPSHEPDRNAMRRALALAAPGLNACSMRENFPRADVQLVIDRSGRSRQVVVRVRDSTTGALTRSERRCIVGIVTRMRWPRGHRMTLRFPVVLR